MWDLLTPAEQRPQVFTRGGDVYDQQNMGFVHETLPGTAEAGYTRLDRTPYVGTEFVYNTSSSEIAARGIADLSTEQN